MTLTDPFPGFQGHGIFEVEYYDVSGLVLTLDITFFDLCVRFDLY